MRRGAKYRDQKSGSQGEDKKEMGAKGTLSEGKKGAGSMGRGSEVKGRR